ncbi:MAG: helicase [Alphaproteobacteria bacterium]|jgi:replicative DNA helicase|nr:helicase [Alphaproteobacteria bacterium]
MTQDLTIARSGNIATSGSASPRDGSHQEGEAPPYNLEAEQSLLGALLLNNASYEHIGDFLRPFHFADGIHGQIFEAIVRLIDRGQVADPITLKDFFDKNEALKPVGGARYLVDLAQSVVSIISVGDYGRLIYDLYLRRQLMGIGEEMVLTARTHELDLNATQQIEEAEKKLFDLATTGNASGGFRKFSDALTESIEMAEIAHRRDSHIVGVTSGLMDLDKWLGGLHPSDLIIIAGRPSMGKTVLGTNIAFNAAVACMEKNKSGASVAFFSLEMSAEQLSTRILGSETGISSDKIRRGETRSEDFSTFVEVKRRLNSIPLFIDDTPALSVSALRTRARRLKRQEGLGLIVIDYLQLMEAGGSTRRADNRVQEISDITRALKALAKELNVPVIALSQLSRAVEQREDKRPQLADLRESGSIEQDADVVMFIFREEYYEVRRQPPEGTDKHMEWQARMNQIANQAEVIIAKQRHGPVGTVRLYFDGTLTRFGNLMPA